MLRASATIAEHPLDLRAVPATDIDPGIPAGRQLLDFADALISDGSSGELAETRQALVDAVESGSNQLSPFLAASQASTLQTEPLRANIR